MGAKTVDRLNGIELQTDPIESIKLLDVIKDAEGCVVVWLILAVLQGVCALERMLPFECTSDGLKPAHSNLMVPLDHLLDITCGWKGLTLLNDVTPPKV